MTNRKWWQAILAEQEVAARRLGFEESSWINHYIGMSQLGQA
jgi:hypothetical protein